MSPTRIEDAATAGAPVPPRRSGVVTFGETMALMSADVQGPLQHARAMTLGIGGSESNFAIALRRLGADVTWIGRVGADSLGDLVLREITAEGVQVIGIRDPAAPTSLMIKERRSSLDTRVWYYRNGNAGGRLTAGDLEEGVIRDAAVLHVTGITAALSDTAREATFAAIDVARRAGVTVSFDLNYRSRLWSTEEAGETYRRIIAGADLVFAGDDEAAIAVGPSDDPLELADRLIAAGASQAIVKLGERGAVAVVDGIRYEQPPVPVKAVDTVGAGDGFVAGYIAEYLLGEPVPVRLRTAATVGAYACTVPGDWEGMPRRDELGALTSREPVAR